MHPLIVTAEIAKPLERSLTFEATEGPHINHRFFLQERLERTLITGVSNPVLTLGSLRWLTRRRVRHYSGHSQAGHGKPDGSGDYFQAFIEALNIIAFTEDILA